MGTVDVKNGVSASFFGAIAGVMLLAIVNLIVSATGGGSVQVIPTLVFDGNFFAFIGDYLGYFFTTASGLILLGATIVFYIVATVFVQKSTGMEHETAAVMRGLLIGLSSGTNLVLATNIYGLWFGATVGSIVGVSLFVLGMLASIKAVSQSAAYQAVIGWVSWLAPMSWLVVLLGLGFALVSLVLALLGLAGIDFLKVRGASTADATVKDKFVVANWKTGTFFLVGGLAGNANYAKTAFNMGNIGFIHRNAQDDHREHEAGHNLSLFAFGWIVHLLGAVDENIVGYHAQALTELMAESHDTSSGGAKLQVWA